MANFSFSDVHTVDHMTHINNLEGILANGLLPHGNTKQKVDISNQAVNQRRDSLEPIYGKKIHDYVPFYFNPRNAMLYQNKEEHLVILGFNKKLLDSDGALFTYGNAARNDTLFSNDKDFLKQLCWDDIFSHRWSHYGECDETIKSRMMSELLIPNQVNVDMLDVIYCKSEKYKEAIQNYFDADVLSKIKLIVYPELFFARH